MRLAFVQAFPQLSGGRVRIVAQEVTYPPGGSSSAHRHGCPVVGYVLEGAVRGQLEGRPPFVANAGQSFFEPAGLEHRISANASATAPAKFLAVFVCDGTRQEEGLPAAR